MNWFVEYDAPLRFASQDLTCSDASRPAFCSRLARPFYMYSQRYSMFAVFVETDVKFVVGSTSLSGVSMMSMMIICKSDVSTKSRPESRTSRQRSRPTRAQIHVDPRSTTQNRTRMQCGRHGRGHTNPTVPPHPVQYSST